MSKEKLFILAPLFCVLTLVGLVVTENKLNNSKVSHTPTTEWKLYQNGVDTFSVPAEWIEKPIILSGSGYTKEFVNPENTISISFLKRGNYNQFTGKPYINIDEYVGEQAKGNSVLVGELEGRRIPPKTAGDNESTVVFFSPDSEFIYTLGFQVTQQSRQLENKNVFDQIVNSYKYQPENKGLGELKTANVLVQDGSYYGPPYDLDLYQMKIDQSHYLFAKSTKFDLKQYLNKQVTIRYREVIGMVMGEQQLVQIESIDNL